MRKWFVIGLMAGMITTAHGAEQLSVAQLEQKLATSLLKHDTGGGADRKQTDLPVDLDADLNLLRDAGADDELARQLFGVELVERLTPTTLGRILAKYQPGLDTERALTFLKDESAFLDPPQAEWLALATPDAESQKHSLDLARGYVFLTLLRLPNFFATRTTTQFVNSSQTSNLMDLPKREGPRQAGMSVLEITFREGKEFMAPTEPAGMKRIPTDAGLASQGEFGPEAAIVLADLADQSNGTIAFHHWEATPAGRAAVYRYAVAAAGSHYQVNYACDAKTPFHAFPGYHGSIAINPATGAILLITLAADSKPGDPISHVTSAIDYGPVTIGDHVYICPLRSITSMTLEADACGGRGNAKRPAEHETMLNRTTFSNYHRLGSTLTILPAEKGEEQGPGTGH
jgi:hypothetical protein